MNTDTDQRLTVTPLGMLVGRASILVTDYDDATEDERRLLVCNLWSALSGFENV